MVNICGTRALRNMDLRRTDFAGCGFCGVRSVRGEQALSADFVAWGTNWLLQWLIPIGMQPRLSQVQSRVRLCRHNFRRCLGARWRPSSQSYIQVRLERGQIWWRCGLARIERNKNNSSGLRILRCTDLRSTDLRNTDLRIMDLRQADLRNTDLRTTDWRCTDLRATDFAVDGFAV